MSEPNPTPSRLEELSPERRAALSKLLGRPAATGAPRITRHGGRGGAPPSFNQERLWALSQLDPTGRAYHMPAVVRLVGRLSVEALDQALDEVIRRHDILRTRFVLVGTELVQVVEAHEPRRLSVVDTG